VLRLAAAPLANGAHHLPSAPRCSVCNHVLARVDAVSPRSRVPQRSTLSSLSGKGEMNAIGQPVSLESGADPRGFKSG